MIFYRPTDGEPPISAVDLSPKTCFIMTQMGNELPPVIADIRNKLKALLKVKGIGIIDAQSRVTGGDYLIKIWQLLISAPIGIAIVHHEMSPETLSNIYYEMGMMVSYGKETLVVKTPDTKIPSDFIRTEYVEYNQTFDRNIKKFITNVFKRAEYFEKLSDQTEKNPLLSIDYLKRAYLITGNENLKLKANEIFLSMDLENRAKNSVENLFMQF